MLSFPGFCGFDGAGIAVLGVKVVLTRIRAPIIQASIIQASIIPASIIQAPGHCARWETQRVQVRRGSGVTLRF